MPKFRKKPVEIEAIQVSPLIDSDNPVTAASAMLETETRLKTIGAPSSGWRWRGNALIISTLEGEMRADPRDWIIRGVKGEFYPCKPDIFDVTYDAA